jgi:hypothetical protein
LAGSLKIVGHILLQIPPTELFCNWLRVSPRKGIYLKAPI